MFLARAFFLLKWSRTFFRCPLLVPLLFHEIFEQNREPPHYFLFLRYLLSGLEVYVSRFRLVCLIAVELVLIFNCVRLFQDRLIHLKTVVFRVLQGQNVDLLRIYYK